MTKSAPIPGVWSPFGLAVVLGLMLAGPVVVYLSGGTLNVAPHIMYFPVVLAALLGGVRSAIAAGIVAGVAIGPFMPLDVAAGIPQPTSGWVLRLLFFVGVGLLVAEGRRRIVTLIDGRQRFISSISHEVRTPLAAVMGFSQILSDESHGLSDAEQREFAELIHQEMQSMSDIVDGYILAARLDDTALTIDPRNIDLGQAVRDSLSRIPGALRDERVQVEAPDAIPAYADPLRVAQITRSIVANALAYGAKSVRVDVTSDGSTGLISVVDMGATVPGAAIGDASSPLHTGGDRSSNPHPVGMGLGVPLRLAQLMGGSLTYRRRERDGVFEVRLPLDDSNGTRRR